MTTYGYTLANLIADVRSLFNEPTAGLVTDAEITTWLGLAQQKLQSKLHLLTKEYTFPIVANQLEYDLPSDFMAVAALYVDETEPIRELTPKEWFASYAGAISAPNPWGFLISSKKTGYSPGKSERFKLSLTPVPTTAATATTLSGNHTDSATTFTVASTTGFPDQGTFKVESEKIRYYAKTATTLLQCIRGEEGTTAAAHLDTVAVTEQNARLIYYYAPAPLGTGEYSEFPVEFNEYLVLFSLSRCHLKDGHLEKYAALQTRLRQMEEEYLSDATRRGQVAAHIQDAENVFEGDLGVQ